MTHSLAPPQEARALHQLQGDLAASQTVITHQFDVIQTRTQALIAMIHYRDRKTRRLRQALLSLAAGLTFCVGSAVAFMLTGL